MSTQAKLIYGSVNNIKPIMVSGVYRSGTTFMTALLGAHPLLESTSLTVKFNRFCLGLYGSMKYVTNRRALVSDTNKRIYTRRDLKLDVNKILNNLNVKKDPSYASIYNAIMDNLLLKNKSNKVNWVEQLNLNWSGIPDFLNMFPNGRVVHVIRDPRDVTNSYKEMTYEKGNTYLDAAFNCRGSMEMIHNIDSHYKKKIYVAKIEDFANEPKINIDKLLKFLKLPRSKEMLNYKNLKTIGSDWSSNTSSGNYYTNWPKIKSRWSKNLSKYEIFLIEFISQPWLSKYGYKTSNKIFDKNLFKKSLDLINDNFLKTRFNNFLSTGCGAEGYRTDPFITEMKKVFPERFIKEKYIPPIRYKI